MSDRKTTEIKLRVTPEEKTRWQLEADKQEISLSESIRSAMNAPPPTQSVSVAPKVCACSLAGKGVCCDAPQPTVGTDGEVGSVKMLRPPPAWMYEARADG
jgi:hypothetical protein